MIQRLQQGDLLRREHWPEGTFIFRQVPSDVSAEIVEKMTSLPAHAKTQFQLRRDTGVEAVAFLYYSDQVAKADAANNIVAYVPTWADLFAEDWGIQGADCIPE